MDEKPKSPHEPILTRLGLILIGVISIASAALALFLFTHYFAEHNNIVEGRSYAFATFAVNSMIYIFAYRSLRRPIWRSGTPLQNMPLVLSVLGGLALALGAFVVAPIRELLGIVPLSLAQWGVIFGVAFALLGVVEIGKLVSNRSWRIVET